MGSEERARKRTRYTAEQIIAKLREADIELGTQSEWGGNSGCCRAKRPNAPAYNWIGSGLKEWSLR